MKERKRLRAAGYDYSSPGAYFATICVQREMVKQNIFGHIENDLMQLNENGKIIDRCWNDLIHHYKNIALDEYVIMPDHFHGIVVVECAGHGLPEIIRGFKTFSSKQINALSNNFSFHWQKSYYDHIVRDEDDLNRIRRYLKNNPVKWDIRSYRRDRF